MRIVIVALILLLGGCETLDRQELTTFEPLKNNRFRYEAKAGPVYRPDTAAGERTRISWLQQYLTDNKLCPNGFTIEQRKVVLVRRAALADLYNIIYYGKCK